jgi:hypothetical protein
MSDTLTLPELMSRVFSLVVVAWHTVSGLELSDDICPHPALLKSSEGVEISSPEACAKVTDN